MSTSRFHIVSGADGSWVGRSEGDRRPLVTASLDHVMSVMTELMNLMGGTEIIIHQGRSLLRVPMPHKGQVGHASESDASGAP